MISKTATRPVPSMRGRSNCEMTALQVRGELDADLLLLVGGEGVDDAVDGAGRAGGVQRGEDQVAGFRGGDGGLDGLQVAHFADEDDVRVLAQGAAQALGKARHIDADFALVDDAALVIDDNTRSGSSMVMMWPRAGLVDESSMQASVVVLPEPVGPVTRTRPRGRSSSSRTAGGRPM